MSNYFLDNADLVATFDRLVPWDRVAPLVAGGAGETADSVAAWREVLAVAGKYVGTEVAARAALVDKLGVIESGGRFEMSEPMLQNLKGLAALGLAAPAVPQEYGGGGLPFTVNAFLFEMVSRACPATQVQHAFYSAPAALIYRYGSEEQRRHYLPRLARGEILGAVAMTEPQAGSDVGAIGTSATSEGDHWCLRGRKQFISAGTGDFVIVLARSDRASRGTAGLGLFIADRRIDGRENYIVERAEHKFTIRGSPTCALSFDATQAEMLGAPGQGWQMILTFMNESRLGVGIQGLGVAQSAYEDALAYATKRVQMGKPIREHPLIAEMLLEMETTIVGLRALITEAAVLQDEVLFSRDAEVVRRASRDLREITPLVKWYGAEEVIRVCRQALQIFGGYGVTTDYSVERHLRDSLILPIYEGTSQIQALMAVKDLMKVVLRRPASLVGAGPSATLARASLTGAAGRDFAAARGAFVGSLRRLVVGLVRRRGLGLLRGGRQLTDDDLAPFLLHAERITEALAHLHVARVLGEQARRVPERAVVASRAARRARLVAERNARVIGAGDGGVFERIATWHAEGAGPREEQ
ncbi:MAG: acyl-CoA dehydrogenase family protein [Chloroflexota bacterium]